MVGMHHFIHELAGLLEVGHAVGHPLLGLLLAVDLLQLGPEDLVEALLVEHGGHHVVEGLH